MLMHRLCPFSRLLPRQHLLHGTLLRIHAKARALHAISNIDHKILDNRHCRHFRRANRLRCHASNAATTRAEPSAAGSTSENVIQVLRARGLIQASHSTDAAKRSSILLLCTWSCLVSTVGRLAFSKLAKTRIQLEEGRDLQHTPADA